jgi:hypothetical protein
MSKSVLVKETKCEVCKLALGPNVYEVDGRMYYNSPFGYVEYDPKADHGLRLWCVVDDNGFFWDEQSVEESVKNSYQFNFHEEISAEVLKETIENLHIPFMS